MDQPVQINDSVEEIRNSSGSSSTTGSNFFKSRFINQSNSYEELLDDDQDKYRTLSTFSGVFAPVALSMFSAILFLRLGYIVGNSGLYLTIFQLILAYTILFFTVLSICSIATNGAIQGGGVYFMISRALGPEFGGAIGTLFFTANVFSSALYLTGCVEGIINNFGPSGGIASILPSNYWWSILYGSILNLMNVVICLIGASLFAKTSVLIFFILLACISSVVISMMIRGKIDIPVPSENTIYNQTLIFTGFSIETFMDNLKPGFTIDYTTDLMTSFALVFGVLFSGVTGIMAGANISGELKDPTNSIPKGTIGAMIFTFVTYLVLFLLTAFTCSRELLVNNYIYFQSIDYAPVLVAIGLFAATFSASLSNLIGASRVLEALSKDKLFGPLLNVVNLYSMPGNPISAVLITWALIQCIIFINKLNLIAQITSVFFLLSYFATNFACLSLTLTSAPNFRPTFKYFSWKTASIGILGTLLMMFVINAIYATITILLCITLIIILHIRSPPFRWGSITQALIFHQVRKYLLLLDSRKDHVKYWRPHILLMVSNPRSCVPLIRFANDLKKSGLFIIGHVKLEDIDEYEIDPILKESPLWLKLLDSLNVKAFFELTLARTVREGFHHLVRIAGLGAMKPNTIFFGFYDDQVQKNSLEFEQMKIRSPDEYEFPPIRLIDGNKNMSPKEYMMLLSDAMHKFQKNVCIGRHFNSFFRDQIPTIKNKRIDIWPINFFDLYEELPSNSWKFMLQLACILQMVPGWKNTTTLRLLITDRFQSSPTTTLLKDQWEKRLKLLRMECELKIVPWIETRFQDDDKSEYLSRINLFIQSHSRESNLIFLHLPMIKPKGQENYLLNLTQITEHLPPTILVNGITEVTSDSL
ncbi:hypothetical protein SSS_10243 [Sarcoptes scabiei]|uniref:Solute carrier family 12 member 9 n=1 Tax=Sarcoptes scabiei TaxID=52283 RepID=A0A834VDM6_SARSC|nr:hypothetical protein SSS_10243 [Sarcoptes scabiei]